MMLYLLVTLAAASSKATTVRVGPSSAANASSVAAGVALVPVNVSARWTVLIEPGVYRERVSTAEKGPLSLVGLGAAAEDVVLVYGCSNNNGTGRAGCRPCPADASFINRATLTVASEDFIAANLTVANDACGYNAALAGQSAAVSIGADRAAFSRCRLLGGQDTLYTGGGTLRSFFQMSFVNGSCDSIYGDSTSVFDNCTITVVDHITAHGGGSICTPKADGGRGMGPSCGVDGHGHGSYYLFLNASLVKPDESEFDRKHAPNTELGRAWGTNAHVIFKDSFLDSHIAQHGWGAMGEGGAASSPMRCDRFGKRCANTSKCWCQVRCVLLLVLLRLLVLVLTTVVLTSQNTTFAEYRSRGPGAAAASENKRVGWSRQLTEREAAAYTAKAALRGWTPLV